MSDEIRVSVSMPLDDDGFLRRECPRCERQFKWFPHDSDTGDAEAVDQYFCPLCGLPSGVGAWWTQEQINYAEGAATPEITRALQDSVADMFKGIKGMTYQPNRNFALDTSTPDPLVEPNDMLIVEPPCHPHEPLKVPEADANRLFCLICGSPFAA